MTWELEDETNYLPPDPPPPPLPHVLDQTTPELRQLFDDILKYRVDPAGKYYGITLEQLHQQISAISVNNIVSLQHYY